MEQNQTPPITPTPPVSPVQEPTPIPQQPAPIPQQPAPAPQPAAPQAPATTQKSNPWPWIVGGCLMFVIIVFIAIGLLSWLGFRMVKKGIQESDAAKTINQNIEKMSKESEEWEKKSEELRNSVPDPEDIEQSYQSNYPAAKK